MIKSRAYFSILAALIFLVVKIFWVSVPTYSMGGARLGDDSLVYLQSGKSNILSSTPHQRIQLEIKNLGNALLSDDSLEFNRARVLMRNTFVAAAPYAFIAEAVEGMNFSMKMTFMVLEIMVAVILTYSIWFFTGVVFNDETSALVLLCLSFAILPNQGLHYLVPSVLTLSLGLILWGKVISGKDHIFSTFLVTFLLITSHQIGLFYFAVAGVVLTYNVSKSESLNVSSFRALFALIFGLIFAILYSKVSGAYASGRGTGGINIASWKENFVGLSGWLLLFLKTQRLLFVVVVAAVVLFLYRRKFNDIKAILFVLLYAALSVSLFHELEGYSGELASRVLVPLVIYSLGFFFDEVIKLSGGKYKLAFVFGLAALIITSQISYFKTIFYRNMSSRPDVVNEELVGSELNQLKSGDGVIWIDTDYAMQLGILLGVPSYLNNLPLPMVDKEYTSDFISRARGDIYAVSVYPYKLNAMSIAQVRTLDKRYYGFGFKYFDDIKISINGDANKNIYVKLADLSFENVHFIDEKGAACVTEFVSESEYETWVKVNKCKSFSVHSKGDVGSIRGIQTVEPNSAVAWPWGQKEITISGRVKGGEQTISQNFDWSNILEKHSFSCLINEYNEWAVVSDKSGLIWLKRKN